MLNKIYDWVDEWFDIILMWRDIVDYEVLEYVNFVYYFFVFVYCFGGLMFFVIVI